MTNLEKRCSAAIEKWCRKNKFNLVNKPRHIHPRAYVIGRAAPGCLIVATPWVDSERQCREFDRDNSLETVRIFDNSLVAGSWATTAYICMDGCSEPMAMPVVE